MREHWTEPFRGDFRAFVALVQQRVRAQWREVRDPDEDALPVLWMQRQGTLHVQQVSGEWMQSAHSKQELVERMILPLIRAGSLLKLALSSAAWIAEGGTPAGEEINRRRVAGEPIPDFSELGLPGVREVVMLSIFDAERHEFWTAPVMRWWQLGPSIGRFDLPGGPDAMHGPMVDEIKAAMR